VKFGEEKNDLFSFSLSEGEYFGVVFGSFSSKDSN
jgi:hypothetical protein